MTIQPLTIHSWPRAILHLDADAFFASCEQVVHPELRGKPLIAGKERGIVAAASYKAKSRGVNRGMSLLEVKNKRIVGGQTCLLQFDKYFGF